MNVDDRGARRHRNKIRMRDRSIVKKDIIRFRIVLSMINMNRSVWSGFERNVIRVEAIEGVAGINEGVVVRIFKRHWRSRSRFR